MKHWLVLESKKDYESALRRAEYLLECNQDVIRQHAKELKLLLFLIEKYEDEHFPIGLPDPIVPSRPEWKT